MADLFKKRCFVCGEKADTLYESMCENCYKENHPPIKEIKSLNIKICNMCGKIHYNNSLYYYEDFIELLPDVMKKRVILNEGYKFIDLDIINLERIGNKITFDVQVKSELE